MGSRSTPWLTRFSSRHHQISRHHSGLWVTTTESVERTGTEMLCLSASYRL